MVDYVCTCCAEKAGGVWPQDHYATFSLGKCDACGWELAICSVSDWHWPQGKPPGWKGTGRD